MSFLLLYITKIGNTMIGAYAIDASMVYSMNKYHEMYRAWVPLMDDEDPDDVGVQGYLKISIQVSLYVRMRCCFGCV